MGCSDGCRRCADLFPLGVIAAATPLLLCLIGYIFIGLRGRVFAAAFAGNTDSVVPFGGVMWSLECRTELPCDTADFSCLTTPNVAKFEQLAACLWIATAILRLPIIAVLVLDTRRRRWTRTLVMLGATLALVVASIAIPIIVLNHIPCSWPTPDAPMTLMPDLGYTLGAAFKALVADVVGLISVVGGSAYAQSSRKSTAARSAAVAAAAAAHAPNVFHEPISSDSDEPDDEMEEQLP